MMVVVADTSPLNYLVLLEAVEIRTNSMSGFCVPEAVINELLSNAPLQVQTWAVSLPAWIEVHAVPQTGCSCSHFAGHAIRVPSGVCVHTFPFRQILFFRSVCIGVYPWPQGLVL